MIIKDDSFSNLYADRVDDDNGDIESVTCVDALNLKALSIIPRYYPTGSIDLNIKDTTTGYDVSRVVSYTILEGVLSFTFSLDAISETRYQITLSEGTEIVYRGIAIATSQDTQSYLLTKDKYYY